MPTTNYGMSPMEKLILGGVVGIVLIAVVLMTVAFEPAGTQGVKLTWGALSGGTSLMQPGLNFLIPVAQSYVLLNTQVQKFQAQNESATSRDLQNVTTDIAVNYEIKPNSAAWIYKNIGIGYQTSLIAPITQETMKAVTANYTAEGLIENRPIVIQNIQERLAATLAAYNITILQISITNFAFSNNFSTSVENKVVAQQNFLRQLTILNTTKVIANQTIALARGNATARIVQANGTAQAAAIINKALADNPNYLKYLSISEWNGRLPAVVGSSSALPLINLNSSYTSNTA